MSRSKKPVKIPFDKNGNQLRVPGYNYRQGYGSDTTAWLDNFEFEDELKVGKIGTTGYRKSARAVEFTSTRTGRKYSMDSRIFSGLLESGLTMEGSVIKSVSRWTFCNMFGKCSLTPVGGKSIMSHEEQMKAITAATTAPAGFRRAG